MPRQKSTMSQRLAMLGVGLLCVAVAGLLLISGGRDRHSATAKPDAARKPISWTPDELPPIDLGAFTNTSGSVRHVGNAVCGTCHANEYASYLRTAHSRAVGKIDLAAEPPDATYDQQATGRTYSVYRQGERMRHNESIGTGDKRLQLVDLPMHFVIGSGHHSRSYLSAVDGFLLESPITWFAAKNEWGMSPGYERAGHAGFRRVADQGCLYCHAGRVSEIENNRYKVRITEQSIGCENCHGPGERHVEQWTRKETPNGNVDRTIVSFAQLTRERSEMICSQCHLRGAATVAVRGRSVSDYVPGMRLTDFRVDYRLKESGTAMKVTGHVEQMRLSKCYQKSPTMSCTSCHDPHAPPTEGNRISYFRNQCLNCHSDQGCSLPDTARAAEDNNCITCHMPQSPTDIDHFAFTHHRVGLHDSTPSKPTVDEIGELVPVADISHLPAQEQRRTLGLAYMEFADKQVGDEAFRVYRGRAFDLLTSLREEGMKDVELEEALARMYWETANVRKAVEVAQGALAMTPDTPAARSNSLFILAESQLRLGAPSKALPHLLKLVWLRRVSEDWNLLAMCHLQLSDTASAVKVLEGSLAIDPYRLDTLQMLVDVYAKQNEFDKRQAVLQRLRQLEDAAKLHSPAE